MHLLLKRSHARVVAFFCVVAIAFFFVAPVCVGDDSQAKTASANPFQIDESKYPGLNAEFARLFQLMQKDVQFPDARSRTELLPLLPQNTGFYVALPNYGETAKQALKLFHDELQTSSVLRDWWEHEGGKAGPKIEDAFSKFSQVSSYLGDEVVIAASVTRDKPVLLAIAKVRKPGLKQVLRQTLLVPVAGKSTTAAPAIRVLDAQELATAKQARGEDGPVFLVRSDYIAVAMDLPTLRRFNTRVEQRGSEFAASDFGRRIAQTYNGGVTTLSALDLQKLLNVIVPPGDPGRMMLEQTGFSDMKYMVWERRSTGASSRSQGELSFIGPRRGIASWLGSPKHLGSLDFVSPKAMMATSFVLNDPGQIYEQVLMLAAAKNPKAAMLAQSQEALGIDLKQGLFRYLDGEVTLELDEPGPLPAWKAIAKVNDAERLQKALALLMRFADMNVQSSSEGGLTYYSVTGKSANDPAFSYVYADGYLISGSSQEAVTEAVRMHGSGESLARSIRFLGSLPPGHTGDASAIFYQDPIAMAKSMMKHGQADLKTALAQLSDTGSLAVAVDADETTIRGVTTSPAFDASAIAVVAAVAIPNLLKSRIAANEASAVGRMRTIVTAQITYGISYPDRGYAPDLATLGPDPKMPAKYSEVHAGLVDETLGCTTGTWCTHAGYRFTVRATCKQRECSEFVAVATPVAENAGTRSFCATSEAVIRYKQGPPLAEPINVSECQTWQPIQ